MGSRYSPSRQSSFSYATTLSRRSSSASNPDVFSDDYALEPIDSTTVLPIQRSTTQSDFRQENHDERDDFNIASYPAIPPRLSMHDRPSSITKRHTAGDSLSISNDVAVSRNLSTSSRFSFVRSQSPYSGPTQPSHPYAMYPQITRTSSIASESTIRPNERPFVATGGPEHPYSLYQQNTVPEEGDEDIGTQPIPLGFPRLGISYQRPTGASRSDVGDIVGTDGHIEQLPPYTRYADNVVAKGDMADIRRSSIAASSRHSSAPTTLVEDEVATEPMDVEQPNEREVLTSGEIKKETWKEKAHQRVCGGIALWLLIIIITMVVFAGVVGGLIGGIVGRHQGTVQALQSSAATTTIWLDADPITTGSGLPACPTGRYQIPLKQTQDIRQCVVQSDYSITWGCMDYAPLGVEILNSYSSTGNVSQSISFDDYSIDPWQFTYGPQPPDFNGTSFQLRPSTDKDDETLGVALFFAEPFDKLLIIPGSALTPDPSKRSVSFSGISERAEAWDGKPLQIGDQPWYCFWNATLSEFWIFLQEPGNASETTAVTSMIPSATSAYDANTHSRTGKVDTVTPNPSMFANPSGWTNVDLPTPTPTPAPAPTPASQNKAKRERYQSNLLPWYPKLVKMIEKRRPEGNVQPYCQRMQVLNDWQIVPTEVDQFFFITEADYASQPASGGAKKRNAHDLRVRDTTAELKSNCVCEWISN